MTAEEILNKVLLNKDYASQLICLATQIQKIILQEREACAKIVFEKAKEIAKQNKSIFSKEQLILLEIEQAIRARK